MPRKPLAYVITHHWLANFGANLQAYATYSALQNRGFDVKFLNYRPVDLVLLYQQRIPDIQGDAHEHFVDTYLPSTITLDSHQDYLDYIHTNPADLYVTGSDAVFRLSAKHNREDLNIPNPFWLPGTPLTSDNKDPLKVALSPSAMGHDFGKLAVRDQEWVRDALHDFDFLSARDLFTKCQMKSVGCTVRIEDTPDPVFSLVELIQSIRHQKYDSNNRYILVGTQNCMPKQWIKKFTKLANQKGFQTVAISSPEGIVDVGTNAQINLPIDSFKWMEYLACSDGYVGGRFHPLVVSLCAGVPIFSFDKYHRWPWRHGRSKSWLLLDNFALSKYCYGSMLHRLLPPFFVLRLLRDQQNSCHMSTKKARCLSEQFGAFLKQSLASF